MKTKPTGSKNPPLAADQWWQIENGYVQITRVGKMLAEYKMPRKPGQRGVRSQLGSLTSVETYLKTNKAKLVPSPESIKPAS
jgi:hypothetical protein